MICSNVSSFWHNKDNSNALPNLVIASIKSFIEAGFNYTLYSYQRLMNVPDKCQLKDANEIVRFDDFFIHKSGSIAPFSDYFRIHLMLKEDTIWTDTDNFFMKDAFNPSLDTIAIIQDGRIQNGFFYTTNKSIKTLLKKFIDDPIRLQSYDSAKQRKNKICALKYACAGNCNYRKFMNWNTCGSELYTNIFEKLGLTSIAYDYYAHFNPFHFSDQYKLFTQDEKELDLYAFKDVDVFTLSTDLLRREPGILANYSNTSYVARLLSKYGVKLK